MCVSIRNEEMLLKTEILPSHQCGLLSIRAKRRFQDEDAIFGNGKNTNLYSSIIIGLKSGYGGGYIFSLG